MLKKIGELWEELAALILSRGAFIRAKFLYEKMADYLPAEGQILDLCCKSGHIGTVIKYWELKHNARHVALLNIKCSCLHVAQWMFNAPCARYLAETNNMGYASIEDDDPIPCQDRHFDCVLVAFAGPNRRTRELKHLLAEAVRVSKGYIIVIDYTPGEGVHDYWVQMLRNLDMDIVHEESWTQPELFGLFQLPVTMFVLEKK